VTSDKVFAIFDLDYTLTQRGTWGRFVWQSVKSRPQLWLPLLISTLTFQLQYKLGKRPRGAVKKTMMKWSLQRHDKSTLKKMAEAFAEKEVQFGLRPGGIAALNYHKQQGHHVIIASAAVDLIVAPIAERLNIDDFVSTELSWTRSGQLLSDFASPNCYGEAKLIRVKEQLSKISKHKSYKAIFYSDSKADLPVLEYVDFGVVVDPSPKFFEYASERGFNIQNWGENGNGFKIVEI